MASQNDNYLFGLSEKLENNFLSFEIIKGGMQRQRHGELEEWAQLWLPKRLFHSKGPDDHTLDIVKNEITFINSDLVVLWCSQSSFLFKQYWVKVNCEIEDACSLCKSDLSPQHFRNIWSEDAQQFSLILHYFTIKLIVAIGLNSEWIKSGGLLK